MTSLEAVEHLKACGVARPSVVRSPFAGEWVVMDGSVRLGAAPTLRTALEAAGYPLEPSRLAYAAVGASVMHGEESVATARSNTMALRIANALNAYVPGRRGY